MRFSLKNSRRPYIRFINGTYRRFLSVSEEDAEKLPSTPHGSYGSMLLDPRWKKRRQEILSRDHHQCINCSSTESLQVHHRQYHFQEALQQFNPPWDYEDQLMITLCERCHRKGHQLFAVPTIYI